MHKLHQLLQDYPSFQPTTKRHLDGRYFNKALRGYPGLVKQPLILRIGPNGWSVHVRRKTEFPMNKLHPTLMRVIIEIQHSGHRLHRHSNLLVIDHEKKTITRFEPLRVNRYGRPVNAVLKHACSRILRNYSFRTSAHHPQTGRLDGMCLAYVLHHAARIAANGHGRVHERISYERVKKFAAAVESEFGRLKHGKRDVEGDLDRSGRTWTGAGLGGLGGLLLIGGPLGLAAGALGGAAVGNLWPGRRRRY